jgi:hypothetical protein
MIKYGLKIGTVGLEFSDQQTREKAMITFCKGSCVDITTYAGPRYKQGEGTFATYERNSEEELINCSKCEGVFSSQVCSRRTVPRTDYSGGFKSGNEEKYLCDGCHTKIKEDYKVYQAKKIIEDKESSDLPI